MTIKTYQLRQDVILIKPKCSFGNSVSNLVLEVKDFIKSNDCPSLMLDLCGLNVIYASQIGILASTHHFIKYLNGNIQIIVDDEVVAESIKKLRLANSQITIKEKEKKDFCYSIA